MNAQTETKILTGWRILTGVGALLVMPCFYLLIMIFNKIDSQGNRITGVEVKVESVEDRTTKLEVGMRENDSRDFIEHGNLWRRFDQYQLKNE